MTPTCFDAGMFLRFGDMARAGLRAATCFQAIVTHERTSTTRFAEDGLTQFQRWARLKVGDVVRVWSGPYRNGGFLGESLLIQVTVPAREIDLAAMSAEEREEWSQAEGWSPAKIDCWILEGHPTRGIQVRYRLSS